MSVTIDLLEHWNIEKRDALVKKLKGVIRATTSDWCTEVKLVLRYCPPPCPFCEHVQNEVTDFIAKLDFLPEDYISIELLPTGKQQLSHFKVDVLKPCFDFHLPVPESPKQENPDDAKPGLSKNDHNINATTTTTTTIPSPSTCGLANAPRVIQDDSLSIHYQGVSTNTVFSSISSSSPKLNPSPNRPQFTSTDRNDSDNTNKVVNIPFDLCNLPPFVVKAISISMGMRSWQM